MRRAALACCAGLALTAAAAGAAELCADGPALRAQGLPALAAEYRQLNVQRGHFDGGAWLAPIDRWGERKQCVMDALRELLAQQRPPLDWLLGQLGPPDARHDDLLWYRWRGTRDGLAVTIVAGRVAAVAWRYAGE